ncbi:pentatricopeptide repeat-containing protein At1g52640, mitochondrial-like [Magnolia sinica]|uniref:pentatricopeptide repeat-containing protein At1g52640, mitochondrial-like n=1 Tax=Magnolia sinica TaxID=86752 RepID=UPI00265AC760|nr:pentatricopeptide repeat-containing protein At1g52640, mitochondrial-like [Magnolia sinica]
MQNMPNSLIKGVSMLLWVNALSSVQSKVAWYIRTDPIRKPEPKGSGPIQPDPIGSNHVSHALEFFQWVKSEFDVGPKTYSILMKGWGDCKNAKEAVKVFDEMLERGCGIDVVSYNMLLSALCRGGKVDEASLQFSQMGSHKLKPNACSYTAFIHAACEANDVHSALRFLDRVRRYELVLNVFTYNCIIKLLCKNQEIDDAYHILDEMTKRGVDPDVWSYNAILAAHCHLCEVNKALRLLHRMKKACCPPDRHTYNMVLKMMIEVGRIDRAMEVWYGIGESGFYPSITTYSVMIHGLCKKRGRIEDACRYFEMMVDEGIPPYHYTCNLLRDCLLQFGLRQRVYILADKMQQSTSCSIQELSEAIISSPARPKKRDGVSSGSNEEE